MVKRKTRFKQFLNKSKYYTIDILFFSVLIILSFMYPNVLIWVWLVLGVATLIYILYFAYTKSKVGGYLKNNNVHMFGYRRKGKDLIIQSYIIWRFKKRYDKIIKKNKLKNDNDIKEYFNEKPLYLSLYDYGYGCKIVDIKEFELKHDNGSFVTYNDFIQGKSFTAKKLDHYEGLDLILGEAQLGLPNTEHNTLDKYYPWLPVFIALSGHLYNMNIIINSQEYSRVWIKLRGQQDTYMRAIKTLPVNKTWFSRIYKYLPFFRKNLYTKVRIFEEQQAAENNTLPFKAIGAVNEAGKTIYLTSGQATKEQFEATNGVIVDYWIKTKRNDIRYDTRIFHFRLFNKPAPKV